MANATRSAGSNVEVSGSARNRILDHGRFGAGVKCVAKLLPGCVYLEEGVHVTGHTRRNHAVNIHDLDRRGWILPCTGPPSSWPDHIGVKAVLPGLPGTVFQRRNGKELSGDTGCFMLMNTGEKVCRGKRPASTHRRRWSAMAGDVHGQ